MVQCPISCTEYVHLASGNVFSNSLALPRGPSSGWPPGSACGAIEYRPRSSGLCATPGKTTARYAPEGRSQGAATRGCGRLAQCKGETAYCSSPSLHERLPTRGTINFVGRRVPVLQCPLVWTATRPVPRKLPFEDLPHLEYFPYGAKGYFCDKISPSGHYLKQLLVMQTGILHAQFNGRCQSQILFFEQPWTQNCNWREPLSLIGQHTTLHAGKNHST